ncbi:metal ABC transporter permease [Corynebacterium sp. AOP40-9SA-29]|uniref:metal ABC transporter permease n=1 Tax=Corynebacterium sp. AOP40-9SA-29 TaxID=3457677 RepID=UPI0040334C5C
MSTWDLLQVDFVQNALLASLLLGLVSGALAPLIVMRRMSFAAHATGELALMGAAAALLFGVSVTTGAVLGAVLAAVVLALLGLKEQDATVGVVLAFGMGLSVLFIYLYPGRTSEAYALLTGQIVGVSGASLGVLALMSVLVAAAVAVLWRPLLFATVDPVMAAASGVPVKLLAAAFAVLIGIVASQGVQIVGALLLLALLITPGAAAVRVTSNPLLAVVLSAIFATTASAGGLVLSLGPGLPVSPFVTTISFVIYLACRTIGWARGRRAVRDETARKGSAVGSLPGSTEGIADPHHAAH